MSRGRSPPGSTKAPRIVAVHHSKVQFCCSGVTGMIAARSGGSRHFQGSVADQGWSVAIAGGSFFIDAATASAWRITRSTLPPASLARFCVGPAAADQLGEQQRIAADAVHARRAPRLADAVEVAADPDMIVAGDLGDMLDMVGDLRDVGARRRMGGLPRLRSPPRAARAGRCRATSAALPRRPRSAFHLRNALGRHRPR